MVCFFGFFYCFVVFGFCWVFFPLFLFFLWGGTGGGGCVCVCFGGFLLLGFWDFFVAIGVSEPQALVSILNCQFEFLNPFSKTDQTEHYIGYIPSNTFWQASEAKSSSLLCLTAWLKKNQNACRKCSVVKVRRKRSEAGNKCKNFMYKWQLECV